MRSLILAASAAFFAPIASAQAIASYEDGGESVTLFKDKCALETVVESFGNKATYKAKSGELTQGCFRINGQMIEIVYEDGDIGRMPAAVFSVVQGRAS